MKRNLQVELNAFRMLYYHDDNTQHQVFLYMDTNMQAQRRTFVCMINFGKDNVTKISNVESLRMIVVTKELTGRGLQT